LILGRLLPPRHLAGHFSRHRHFTFPPLIYFNAFPTCDVRITAAGQEVPGRNAANLVAFQQKR
jgi:hypothetical protein